MSPPPSRAPTGERTQLVNADFVKKARTAPAKPSSPPPSGGGGGPGGGRNWRPFRFTGLPKVSGAEALLVERLEWLMPPAFLSGSSMGVRSRLNEIIEADVGLMIDSFQALKPKDVRKLIAPPTFLGILAPAPHKARGFIEIELGLAHAVVDSMLGGSGEVAALRPLTDIEEGVLSYLVLEVLKSLAPNMEPGLPKLRLEGVARSPDDAAAMLAEEPYVLALQLKATVGNQAGFVRLFIPGTVIGMTNPPQDGPERRARRRMQREQNIDRLRGVKTSLRAEIGRAEILAADLAAVQPRDVVLMDEVSARPDKNEGGTARLKIGAGRVGRMDAEVAIEDGRWVAKVTAVVLGDEPREAEETAGAKKQQGVEESTTPGARTGESESHVDENAAEGDGGDLLNDIPLQIAVELSRVAITAEEVVALKIGQVLDLQRVPGEPVDLSVNGKIVARGELVEVEGHLGVRILSLAG